MIRTSAVLLVCTLFLAGCARDKPQIDVPQKALPSWYTQPPQSTAETLYATGEGVDRPSAVNDALSLMASNLSVTIASDYTSTATESRRNGRSDTSVDISNTIRSEVQKIRISNYRIVQSVKQGFRKYLVLIKADKRDIFMTIKRDIDQQYDSLQQHEKDLSGSDALTRLLFYKRALRDTEHARDTLLILGVLDRQFDSEPYRNVQNTLVRKYELLRAQIRFSVIPKTALAEKLAPVLREGITSQGIRLGDTGGNDHFDATIDTHTERAYSLGFFLARTAIDLQVSDSHGNRIGSRTLHLVGQSSQSDAIAEENVAVKLKKVLKEEGVYSLLGLSE